MFFAAGGLFAGGLAVLFSISQVFMINAMNGDVRQETRVFGFPIGHKDQRSKFSDMFDVLEVTEDRKLPIYYVPFNYQAAGLRRIVSNYRSAATTKWVLYELEKIHSEYSLYKEKDIALSPDSRNQLIGDIKSVRERAYP
jgi:hypothetical protein